VLISVDEYFVGFRGSSFELLSTMEGEDTEFRQQSLLVGSKSWNGVLLALIQARTSVHKHCRRLRATLLPRDWPRNCKYNRKNLQKLSANNPPETRNSTGA
jgi:hypothetical protein